MNTPEPRHVTRKDIARMTGLSVRQVATNLAPRLPGAEVRYGGRIHLYKWRVVKPILLDLGFDLYGI